MSETTRTRIENQLKSSLANLIKMKIDASHIKRLFLRRHALRIYGAAPIVKQIPLFHHRLTVVGAAPGKKFLHE